MNRAGSSYREQHEPSSHDLPTIFSSLEIGAQPSVPIDDEQQEILVNALRSRLNLSNVDDILYKEMAEAMIRCKLRCTAEEQEETREKLHRMSVQDENCQRNGNGCDTTAAGRERGAEECSTPRSAHSLDPEVLKIPLPDSPWPETAQKVKPTYGSTKNGSGTGDNRMQAAASIPSETTPQSYPTVASAKDGLPLPPESPGPDTAQNVPPGNRTFDYTPLHTEFAIGTSPSASMPYTPVATAEDFNAAMNHPQDLSSASVTPNVQKPTFLFGSPPVAADGNACEDGSRVGKVEGNTAARTVRFEVGTKDAPEEASGVNPKPIPTTGTKNGKMRRKTATPPVTVPVASFQPAPFVAPACPPNVAGLFPVGAVPQPPPSFVSSQPPVTANDVPAGGAPVQNPVPVCFNLGTGPAKRRIARARRPGTQKQTNLPPTSNTVHGQSHVNPDQFAYNPVPTPTQTVNANPTMPPPPPYSHTPSATTPMQTSTPSFFSPMDMCSPINGTPTPGGGCEPKQPSVFSASVKGTNLFTVGSDAATSSGKPRSSIQSNNKARSVRRAKVPVAAARVNVDKSNQQAQASAAPILNSSVVPPAPTVHAGEKKESPSYEQKVDFTGRLARVKALREEARAHYSRREYKSCILMYTEAIMILSRLSPMTQVTTSAANSWPLTSDEEELLAVLYGNRAAALMMVGAFEVASRDCETAFQYIDGNNPRIAPESGVTLLVKLHCRMARASLKLGNIEESQRAFSYAKYMAEYELERVARNCGHDVDSSAVRSLNQTVVDATAGIGDVNHCRELMEALRSHTTCLHMIEKALAVCPGLVSLQEKRIESLAASKEWPEVAFYCEKLACDAVKFDGVFTADLYPFEPFPGVERAKHLKPDFFSEEDTLSCNKRLLSKAVAEAVLRLPNSILPFYLRALRLEERYTEAARACTALEALCTSTSPRYRARQGGYATYGWVIAERDKLRRTVSKKDHGDTSFKSGDYHGAATDYTACLCIDSENGKEPKVTAGGRLHAVLYCNRAACYMALKKYREAAKDCTSALFIQSNYLKAMLRRARSYARLEKYKESISDFAKWMASVENAKANPTARACIFEAASDITPDEIDRVSKEMEDVKRAMQDSIDKTRAEAEARAAQRQQRRDDNFNRQNQGWKAPGQFGDIPRKGRNPRNKPANKGTASGAGAGVGPGYFYGGGASRYNESEGNKYGPSEADPPTDEAASHYAVLQVSRNCSEADIKKAYRKLALKYHPDKNSDPAASDIFRRVNAAYEVLGDISARRKYDATLHVRFYY